MTNPDNAVGTNAAYGGRTSANAFNDGLASFGRGILNGWACLPSSGLKVTIGGQSGVRDVAIAQDDNGNNTTINNISGSPIEVTIGAAPGTNSRIDSIVAYVDNPPEGADTEADNPDACGLIVVPGTVSSSPSAPNNSTIRSAITADGGAGTTAYYVVIANILMSSGTTDITSNLITPGIGATVVGAFSRYINGTQSIIAWTGANLQVNNKDFDDVGCTYDSGTHAITITKGGVWVFTASAGVCGSGANNYGGLSLNVNNTTITTVRARGNSDFPASSTFSSVVMVKPGDVVTAFVAGSADVSNSTRQMSNFSGACIMPV